MIERRACAARPVFILDDIKPGVLRSRPPPVIGMGEWITFNVGEGAELRRARLRVLQTFFDRGGGLSQIEPSPLIRSIVGMRPGLRAQSRAGPRPDGSRNEKRRPPSRLGVRPTVRI